MPTRIFAADKIAFKSLQGAALGLLGIALVLACASPAQAQKKKKGDAASENSSNPLPLLNDVQQIDYMLSEMLGAWQIGDVERMHKDYADDVSVVNGSWAPPVVGWTNYAAIYQQQREHLQQVRLDRSNTYIKVSGAIGWACYQWDFGALVDGQPKHLLGQTTVVVEKRNSHWVIVHNHTSLVQEVPVSAPAAAPTAPPPAPKPAPR